jgi:hypothetical protein
VTVEGSSSLLGSLSGLAINWDESATSFSHQVAAQVPDKFSNFYFVKNNKTANSSTTTEA